MTLRAKNCHHRHLVFVINFRSRCIFVHFEYKGQTAFLHAYRVRAVRASKALTLPIRAEDYHHGHLLLSINFVFPFIFYHFEYKGQTAFLHAYRVWAVVAT